MKTRTRFEKLNRPSHVAAAEKIAVLALAEEDANGKPILYMTAYEIGKAAGLDTPVVAKALRLASTSEFAEEHGFSFVLPGNGRGGDRYGYILQHDRSRPATGTAMDNLNDTDAKLADHLRGVAAHWKLISYANSRTKLGGDAEKVESILLGAAAAVEMTLGSDES